MINESEWTVAYRGYGKTEFESVLVMEPKTEPPGTVQGHGALVLSKLRVKDFDITVDFVNIRQLRTPSPNPWEVFWFFFNYNIDPKTKKKKCNTFNFKPSGIGLGTAFDQVGQTFIHTNSAIKMEFGRIYSLNIFKRGQKIDIALDGKQIVSITATKAKPLVDEIGNFGLYCEDCLVVVKKFAYKAA